MKPETTRRVLLALLLTTLASVSPAQEPRSTLPDCEWCGATEAPPGIGWKTTIPPQGEPGEWITVKGRVVHADKKTPAADVIVYVYHTNADGIYPRRGDETGNGRRHGYLRGWMKTNAMGEYQFTTIKPAAYPTRTEPAHIHVVVQEPGKEEYWLDSYMFDDDPLLTRDRRSKLGNRGGSGIITLERNRKGVLEGYRNLILLK
jgi:protocatechuate 3,4-dioxygenase beta subunit